MQPKQDQLQPGTKNVQKLQDIETWVGRDVETFTSDILDAFQFNTEFEHPLYDLIAHGTSSDHRDLCFHTILMWRMSKLARLQLTQLSMAHMDELSAVSQTLEATGLAMGAAQIDQARAAINGMEELIRAFAALYGDAPLPELLKVIEDDTILKFFDRVDKACWSERLGWSVASDYSWTHSAPSIAAGLAVLGLRIVPAHNPFCHPGRYVLSSYRNAQAMLLQLTTVAKRAAFVRGVLVRNAFHHEIWDGFTAKFAEGRLLLPDHSRLSVAA
jgi:hypothetical protein